MDPHEQAQLEREATHHAVLGLRSRAMLLRGIVSGSMPRSKEPASTMAMVNQTKSSPFAAFKRRHPGMPLLARISLAVAALCLGGLVAWLVKKRSQ